MTPYSSESASVVSGTTPSASNRVPRWTSSVASPPSSSSMFGPTTSPDSSRNSKRRWVAHQYWGSVSPFQANTGTPEGCSGVPSPTTIAAAAWSCVEKMLQLTHRTSAPSEVRVSMRTAVCTVMCSEPAMRAPASGWASPYSARRAIRPGISCSASWISLRPKPARERSATLKSPSVRMRASVRVPVLAVMSLQGAGPVGCAGARRDRHSAVCGIERACRGFGGARTAVQTTARERGTGAPSRETPLPGLEQPRPGLARTEHPQLTAVLVAHPVALAQEAPEHRAPLRGQAHHQVAVELADPDALLRGVGHHGRVEQRHVPPLGIGGGDGGRAGGLAQQLPGDPLGQHR